MGGNGQYNRLAALDAIAEGSGPWRNRLTEDQDLGLRLIEAGWHSRQEVRAAVDQQGVPRLRPLFRQRTRWAQGNLQALRLLAAVWRAPLARRVRVEEVAYLLMPVWQAVVGVGFAVAVYLWVSGQASLMPTPVALLVAYLLAFSNTILGCLASRGGKGWRPWLVAIGLAHLYALYTWLLWPVLVRATARIIGTQREWAKTEREPLASPSSAPSGD
jgi:cellulose synthase/poly-beta-1,6-N-acetylglucosamine synthase-like glycosyltransferase